MGQLSVGDLGQNYSGGYSGGYTMLKLFVASLRPQQAIEPVVRFETGPGEQMQVDWAVIRRRDEYREPVAAAPATRC